jgi:hypothetical protein
VTDEFGPGGLLRRSVEDCSNEVALCCGVGLALIGVLGSEDTFESGVVRGQSRVSAQGVVERDLLVPARAVRSQEVEVGAAPPVG